LGQRHRFVFKEGGIPFSSEGGSAKYWQRMYASAVVLTQALQRHALDPSECQMLRSQEIHHLCTSNGIFTDEEDVVFKISVLMLEERHTWSYGGGEQLHKKKEEE
jgi:hypothetical protein